MDPVGSVSVVDVHEHTKNNAKPKAKDNVTIGFEAFNVGGPRDAELPAGVRIYGPGASVAQDLEPEYITVLDDNGPRSSRSRRTTRSPSSTSTRAAWTRSGRWA